MGEKEKVVNIQTSTDIELLFSITEDMTFKVRMRKFKLNYVNIPFKSPSLGIMQSDSI